jgi:peptidylprolyl isomerase
MKKSYLVMLSLILAALLLVTGCGGGAAVVKAGDTVKVDYTGTLSDGTQFDSSVGRDPLEFTVNSQQVIKGFDDAVIGMKVGDKKIVTIPAAEAYGAYDDSLVFEYSKTNLPSSITPSVGMQLQMTQTNGQKATVTIKAINDTTLTLDANAPLAGKDLTFEITLVDILKK